MDLLHKLSAALLEREILDSSEIDTIMRGEKLPPLEILDVNGSTVDASGENGSAGKTAEEKSPEIKKD